MAYQDKTPEEVEAGLREICRTAKSEAEVKQRIKDELGYPDDMPGPAVISTSTSIECGPTTMTMTMNRAMIFGPDEGIICV